MLIANIYWCYSHIVNHDLPAYYTTSDMFNTLFKVIATVIRSGTNITIERILFSVCIKCVKK